MSGANTVIDLKSAFIRRQTRILSQPLQAPQQWKNDCDIPEAAVRSAMREVNRRLARHNRTVYPSISIRHTAETIDALYWQRSAPQPSSSSSTTTTTTSATAQPDASTPSRSESDPFHPAADLTHATTIAALPRAWADLDADVAASLLPARPKTHPQTTTQHGHAYNALSARLHALSARRNALRHKLSRFRALRAALAPLAAPAQNVQPNLATRDGELAGELARMRALGVRVAARIGARREREREREGEAVKKRKREGERGNEEAAEERANREEHQGVEDGAPEDNVVICDPMEAQRQRERQKLDRVLQW